MYDAENFLLLSSYTKQLCEALGPLPSSHRIAFAAWCCERMLPWYHALAAFLGIEDKLLRSIADETWRCTSAPDVNQDQLVGLQDQLYALDLGSEGCSIFRKSAMDTLGAVILALDVCKEPTAESATKVGACVIDRAHGEIMALAWEIYDRPLRPDDVATIESQIARHPTMLEELRRQSLVVRVLQRTPKIDQETVRHLVELSC